MRWRIRDRVLRPLRYRKMELRSFSVTFSSRDRCVAISSQCEIVRSKVREDLAYYRSLHTLSEQIQARVSNGRSLAQRLSTYQVKLLFCGRGLQAYWG